MTVQRRGRSASRAAPAIVAAPSIITPNVWPLQSQVAGIDGTPEGPGSKWYADHIVDVACPWPLDMDGTKVTQIAINKLVAPSLTQVLTAVWGAVGKDLGAIQALHYHKYSGSFNIRPMRGGSQPSMHSYGRAIDWDSDENAQHSTKHLFTDSSLLIVKFKEAGWIWGGNWGGSSIDSMHLQSARVHS
jgi:D-alanyl-D-alanine carboxypeptidase